MPNILNIRNANDYRPYVRLEDRYPLVNVVEYADVSPVRSSLNSHEVWFFRGTMILVRVQLPVIGQSSLRKSGRGRVVSKDMKDTEDSATVDSCPLSCRPWSRNAKDRLHGAGAERNRISGLLCTFAGF